ncbi:hypothetical protein EU527_15970 [Candidatus Thorarchaeota archaeon]|nr:MAG: hypothetical protein EU527_15970 [Candidatus Thorarchaeota archaeon]
MPSNMSRGKRFSIFVTLIALFALIAFVPECSAAQNNLKVIIDHADYCALEDDGIEDDILIDFTVIIPSNAKVSAKSDFYLTMTLPSGIQHLALITVIGKFTELKLRVHWYNTAWESGWYNLIIDAFTYGLHGSYSTSIYDFDPPKTGTGEPSIYVMIL